MPTETNIYPALQNMVFENLQEISPFAGIVHTKHFQNNLKKFNKNTIDECLQNTQAVEEGQNEFSKLLLIAGLRINLQQQNQKDSQFLTSSGEASCLLILSLPFTSAFIASMLQLASVVFDFYLSTKSTMDIVYFWMLANIAFLAYYAFNHHKYNKIRQQNAANFDSIHLLIKSEIDPFFSRQYEIESGIIRGQQEISGLDERIVEIDKIFNEINNDLNKLHNKILKKENKLELLALKIDKTRQCFQNISYNQKQHSFAALNLDTDNSIQYLKNTENKYLKLFQLDNDILQEMYSQRLDIIHRKEYLKNKANSLLNDQKNLFTKNEQNYQLLLAQSSTFHRHFYGSGSGSRPYLEEDQELKEQLNINNINNDSDNEDILQNTLQNNINNNFNNQQHIRLINNQNNNYNYGNL